MKKNNVLKVVLISIIVTVLLTWVLPITYFNGTIVEGERFQLGIVDLFRYLTEMIPYFGDVFVYILVVGGFYGVLYQTDGYRNLLDKIVQKYKEREWLFLTIVMILFSVMTSVSGLSLHLFFIFPAIITIILLMGYSKITALLTTVGSICVGFLGNTYAVSEGGFGVINSILKLDVSSEIITKVVLLVVGLVILIFNVLNYAKEHRVEEARKGFLYPESSNTNAKTWPIVLVLDVVLLIMILSHISWNGAFEVTFFDEILKSIQEVKIGDFPIFSKLFGSSLVSFGNWGIPNLINLILVATVFVTLLCKVKLDDMFKSFGAGSKHALRPAFITFLVYLVLFVSVNHPFTLTIIKPIFEITENFNVITTSISGVLSHLFSIDIYYSAGNTLQYITSVITDTSLYGIIAVIWQATYGFSMLFVPTSAVLILGLSYLNVSYLNWLKAIWKIILELLVVMLGIFLILVLI